MADPRASCAIRASGRLVARSRCAFVTGARSTTRFQKRPHQTGGPLHGLRHTLLSRGLPTWKSIPEWNDLVFRGRFDEASSRLHATNNFPEFTGRLCPAPCEGSCVLGISAEPVAIKQVGGRDRRVGGGGGLHPVLPDLLHDQRVAVIGSGPAGLAVAQQLTRAGYHVEVFERAERIGGLLRYGVPEFKLEKRVIDRACPDGRRGNGLSTRVAVGAGSRHEVSGAAARTRRSCRSRICAAASTRSCSPSL